MPEPSPSNGGLAPPAGEGDPLAEVGQGESGGRRGQEGFEKKWAKEVARCLAEGVQPEDIHGVKEAEGNVKEEDPNVEVEEAQEEEAKGSGDVVQCWWRRGCSDVGQVSGWRG